MKTAFIFPGQGTQAVGMGRDFTSRHPAVFGPLFEEANDILGFDLKKLCFQGPIEELTDTSVAQSAIYTVSVGVHRLLTNEGFRPDIVAGLSLGQFAAIAASGAMTFQDGLQIVKRRGKLMSEVKRQGDMVAVITLNEETMDQVKEVVALRGGNIGVDNSPTQLVLSGEAETMKALFEELGTITGVKPRMLRVSQAFHSDLMIEMEDDLMEYVAQFPLKKPDTPIILNCGAQVEDSLQGIIDDIRGQCTKTVQWRKTVDKLAELGVETLVEVGASRTLVGLMKAWPQHKWTLCTTDSTSNYMRTVKTLKTQAGVLKG
ncbi:acyltransferase domain-containing protein [Tumebacillus sp. ITR2]|uniref:Malonyl CoA-acyl carrier protein transacylase n=1 Tax=Tumebacillus amylolyticus TaxID=2801339 RepID=A0ABS1JA86_9BACL|nr:acyltransferase domain-containing protein [Tumebacillus amylolyticus]MBL0387164.1 acyltransferase domain-containing protein [Tumebacillus amylolyticus]